MPNRVRPAQKGSGRGLQRWIGSSALRAVGTMAGATGLGQLAILATLPFITRLYEPTAFGLHALLVSFVGVATVGACLALELAIVQSRTDDAADEICVAALSSLPLTAGISAVMFAALIGTGSFGYGGLPWWSVPVVAAMVFANGLYVASRYRLLREQRYKVLARATVVQGIGRSLAPLGWYVLLPTWAGLSLGELTGRLLGVRRLIAPLLAQLRSRPYWGSLDGWWTVVRRERRYTVFVLAAVLTDSLASLLIAPLLANGYGSAAAGEYFLVAMVLVAPSALIGTASADFIHARGALLNAGTPAEIPAFLRRAAGLLFVAGCAIYLPVYFLAPYVFPILFGARWTLIAPIAQAMTPFMIVAFFASPCSRLLLVLERPNLKVVSDVLRLVGTLVVLAGASALGLPFERAMWALAWFLAFSYGVYFLLTYSAAATVARATRRATC